VSAAGSADREEAAERHRRREFVAGDRAGGAGLWPPAQLERFPRGRRGLPSEAPTKIHRPMTYTGRDVCRLEDADLLRGAGRFADDLPVWTDTLHAAILRSPHAHARITGIHLSAARTTAGVCLGLAGADLIGRISKPNWVIPGTVVPTRPVIAVDRVRFVVDHAWRIDPSRLAGGRDSPRDHRRHPRLICLAFRRSPARSLRVFTAWVESQAMIRFVGISSSCRRSARLGSSTKFPAARRSPRSRRSLATS
jgi:Aldehyde oxidase and xanthine dehydrogenase, a/b hammerhead domain